MVTNMTYNARVKTAKKQWLEQIESLECTNFNKDDMFWARLTCTQWEVKVGDMLSLQLNDSEIDDEQEDLSDDEKLDIATDALRDMLDDVDGDYDIHNFIDDVAIRYDVSKRGLLDWYDNEY